MKKPPLIDIMDKVLNDTEALMDVLQELHESLIEMNEEFERIEEELKG